MKRTLKTRKAMPWGYGEPPKTARVIVAADADVVGPGGQFLRGLVYLDVDVPYDADLRRRSAGKWGPYREIDRSEHYVVGEHLFRSRLSKDRDHSVDRALMQPAVEPGDFVFHREVPAWLARRRPFAFGTGWSYDNDLKIFAYGDAPLKISGRFAHDYDLSDVHRRVEEIRAEAPKLLMRRPEGLFLRAPECRIVIDLNDAPRLITETDFNGSIHTELIFSIDRWDDAVAFLKVLHPDAPIPRRPYVRIDDPEMARPARSDIVRLAAAWMPRLAAMRIFDPVKLAAELVTSWHEIANCRTVLQRDGEDGARDLLRSAVRMIDHAGLISPNHLGLDALRRLRRRIEFEGIVPPSDTPVPEGPRP